jgi:hypothetical protein
MGVSWNRNDEDVLPISHLAAHLIVSMLGWTLGGLIALVIYRVGRLFV